MNNSNRKIALAPRTIAADQPITAEYSAITSVTEAAHWPRGFCGTQPFSQSNKRGCPTGASSVSVRIQVKKELLLWKSSSISHFRAVLK